MNILTRKEFEELGYVWLPYEKDRVLLCGGEPVRSKWCEENCSRYYSCQNIADMDDALKAYVG